MCDCRQDLEKAILDSFNTQIPEAINRKVNLTGYTLIFSNPVSKEVGCMRIKNTADYPLKKGGYKTKTINSVLVFTYCPFCGEKY